VPSVPNVHILSAGGSMDPQRFDALARTLATSGSRRRVLTGLAAGALGMIGIGAEARTCTGAGTVCRENANCCSGYCGPQDASGRRRCACVAPTVACDGRCVDPATAYLSDVGNCGACGKSCSRTRCQIATCVNGVCGLAPDSVMVGRSCDDGNRCTVNDVCRADGSCAGTAVTCTPQDQCHSAACNQATGACDQTPLSGIACNDGDPCITGETCTVGVCGGGTPVDCSHLNGQCVEGFCSGGACFPRAANVGNGCDDGNVCTTGTTCQSNGTCGGGSPVTDGTGCPGGLCCGGVCRAGNCCSNADCTAPQTCGGSGTPNVCGCTPKCAGKACGASDECGGICQTGSCPVCQTCVAGTCQDAASDSACGTACCDGACCPQQGQVCGSLYQAGIGCCYPAGTLNVCTSENFVSVCCSGTNGVGCRTEPTPNMCLAPDL
jgi:hypothetical protein